jgi:WD40 repeat protein
MRFSPNGQYLASVGHHRQVLIFSVADTNNISLVRSIGFGDDSTGDVEFTKDSRLMISSTSSLISIYDTILWNLIDSIEVPCKHMCLSPDSKRIAGMLRHCIVFIFD